ncbi:nitroreductase family protein [Candidatus Pacearchaeota archaeon]|nr:nitroreductase family protein [Candidatus Pacearchaeota archaeon]
MDLDKAIKERHSSRRYSSKKVAWQDIMKAVNLARLAPLAGNIPTLKFVVIDDKETMQKLADACQQDFVATAKYVVAVCSDNSNLLVSYEDRAKKYSHQQAGAAIENFLLKIAELRLTTCWVGAFVDEQVKSILKIPGSIEVEALFPIGYEMPPKSKQRTKINLDRMLFFNSWGNRYMVPLKKPEGL